MPNSNPTSIPCAALSLRAPDEARDSRSPAQIGNLRNGLYEQALVVASQISVQHIVATALLHPVVLMPSRRHHLSIVAEPHSRRIFGCPEPSIAVSCDAR
ncbi:hypothetical protein APR11_000019 [Nocardia amikacinitolerans]|nr:hypothetical protein [Nocardia amikacinitolerans]